MRSRAYNDRMQSVNGKTVVVTGSSTGIGRAIALKFSSFGAHVVVCASKSSDAAEEVVEEVRRHGVESTHFMADLSEPAASRSLVENAWAWRNGVDIWVNNAGVDVLTGEMAEATFSKKIERLWHVDVMGAIHCSREVGKRMREAGGGHIINIGWDQAWEGMEGDSGEMFATIKGAVMAFSKSLAKSLSPEVRVNCVAPGWIKTAWGDEASDYWQQRAISESLRGRWGTPDDIANVVCFLASKEADFVNGQIVPVNGGFRAARPRSGDAK